VNDQDDIARYELIFAELERVAVTGEAAQGALSRISDDYRRL
jgi:hypothetical protein